MSFTQDFSGGYNAAASGGGLVYDPATGLYKDPATGQLYPGPTKVAAGAQQGGSILDASQPAAGQATAPAASEVGGSGMADSMGAGVGSADFGSILGNNGKKAQGESIGGAVGTGVGTAVGGPVGGAVGGAVGSAVGGKIAGDDKEEETTAEKIQKEQLKKAKRENMAKDPSGISSQAYTLAHMGPLSRIPGVANFMLKTAGEDPLSKKEAVLNLVRPPIPAYNAAMGHKMQATAGTMARARSRLGALGLGVGALNALSGLATRG